MERLYSYPTEIVELEFADRISYLIRLWENFSKQSKISGQFKQTSQFIDFHLF